MPPPDKDTRAGRNDTRMMQTEWRPESLQLAQEIKQHAEARGITAGQFAVSWVLNSAFVSGVIAGPRTEAAMGRLSARARLSLHRRGRGPDRPAGRIGPSLDAGLQRSGLSDRGTAGAHGGVTSRGFQAAQASRRSEAKWTSSTGFPPAPTRMRRTESISAVAGRSRACRLPSSIAAPPRWRGISATAASARAIASASWRKTASSG